MHKPVRLCFLKTRKLILLINYGVMCSLVIVITVVCVPYLGLRIGLSGYGINTCVMGIVFLSCVEYIVPKIVNKRLRV